jgi:hypothetical protein
LILCLRVDCHFVTFRGIHDILKGRLFFRIIPLFVIRVVVVSAVELLSSSGHGVDIRIAQNKRAVLVAPLSSLSPIKVLASSDSLL